MNIPENLRVLFLASEADPIIKVGGLGDVAGSLPVALSKLSRKQVNPIANIPSMDEDQVDVRLVLPFHGAIRPSSGSLDLIASYDVPHRDGPILASIFQMKLDGMPVYLISGSPIPEDAPVYTGDNDIDGFKYYFFSLAALELPKVLGWQPHILHANDWHAAPAVYRLGLIRSKDPFYSKTASLQEIHNLPYLGNGAGKQLIEYCLPPAKDSILPWWAQDLPLPLGLLAADHIVTVSPTYAKEILTPEFGSGLQDFLHLRKDSITGILNGIDTKRWDPCIDRQLPATFDSLQLPKRQTNKAALQKEFSLEPDPRIPLLGAITRMEYQKGIDLTINALRMLKDLSWQAILLGTGTPELEEAAQHLQAEFPDRVRTIIRFDPALSRRIFGGSDVLLIPSRYEPCGLTQMIAMRYGCVPVGRATGGLYDTIKDESLGKEATGFLFGDAVPEALAETIRRAVRLFLDPYRWIELQQNGMSQDFSWIRSAYQYFELYLSILKKRGVYED